MAGNNLERCVQLLSQMLDAEGRSTHSFPSRKVAKKENKAVKKKTKSSLKPASGSAAARAKIGAMKFKVRTRPKAITVLRSTREETTASGRMSVNPVSSDQVNMAAPTPAITKEFVDAADTENEPPTRDTEGVNVSSQYQADVIEIPTAQGNIDSAKFNMNQRPLEPFKLISTNADTLPPQRDPRKSVPYNQRLPSSTPNLTPAKYPASYFSQFATGRWDDTQTDKSSIVSQNQPLNSTDQVYAVAPPVAQEVPKLLQGKVEFQPNPGVWYDRFMTGQGTKELHSGDRMQPAKFDGMKGNQGTGMEGAPKQVGLEGNGGQSSSVQLAEGQESRPPADVISPFRLSRSANRAVRTINPPCYGSSQLAGVTDILVHRVQAADSIESAENKQQCDANATEPKVGYSLHSTAVQTFSVADVVAESDVGHGAADDELPRGGAGLPTNRSQADQQKSKSGTVGQVTSKPCPSQVKSVDAGKRTSVSQHRKPSRKTDKKSPKKVSAKKKEAVEDKAKGSKSAPAVHVGSVKSRALSEHTTQQCGAGKKAGPVNTLGCVGASEPSDGPTTGLVLKDYHEQVVSKLRRCGQLLKQLKDTMPESTEHDVQLHQTLSQLQKMAATDWPMEFELAVQPLRSENAQLRRRLRIMNQQLRDKDSADHDAVNQPDYFVIHAKMEKHSLQKQLVEEQAGRERLRGQVEALQQEAGRIAQEKQQLLHIINTKDSEQLAAEQLWLEEVQALKSRAAAAQQDRDKLDKDLARQLHHCHISIKQKDQEIEKQQDLVRSLQLSMSRLVHELQTSRPSPFSRVRDGLHKIEEILNDDSIVQDRSHQPLSGQQAYESKSAGSTPNSQSARRSLNFRAEGSSKLPLDDFDIGLTNLQAEQNLARSQPVYQRSRQDYATLVHDGSGHGQNRGDPSLQATVGDSPGQPGAGRCSAAPSLPAAKHPVADVSIPQDMTFLSVDSYLTPPGGSTMKVLQAHTAPTQRWTVATSGQRGSVAAPIQRGSMLGATHPGRGGPPGVTVKDLLSPYTDRLQLQYKRLSMSTDSDTPGSKGFGSSATTRTSSSPIAELSCERDMESSRNQSEGTMVEVDDHDSTLVDDDVDDDEPDSSSSRINDPEAGIDATMEARLLGAQELPGVTPGDESRYSVTDYFSKYPSSHAKRRTAEDNTRSRDDDRSYSKSILPHAGGEPSSLSPTADHESLLYSGLEGYEEQKLDGSTSSQESLYKGTELDTSLSTIPESETCSVGSSVSSVGSVDDAAFKDGLASLDANIAKIQQQLHNALAAPAYHK